MPSPTLPPDADAVRRLIRPRLTELPAALAGWPDGRGLLADIPLLHPDHLDPRSFEALQGTVRVVGASTAVITLAGLLDLPDDGGILLTAVTIGPDDLGGAPDPARARQALAAEGARRPDLPVEVVALLRPLDGPDGPVAGVGITRPLVLADPGAFPHPDDPTAYDPGLVAAVRLAHAEDREAVADLAGGPLQPLGGPTARIWSPIFAVARSATVGLAAQGALGL